MSAARIKGIPVTLGDREYILPPANLATLEALGPKLDSLNAKLTASPESVVMSDFSVAADLVQAALDFARSQGLRVRPTCSYVASYMQRRPETQDLLESP